MSGPDPDLLNSAIAAIEPLLSSRSARPFIIGICGAQGSGKSTLADALAARLGQDGYPTAILSIDDLYLTRRERVLLAGDVHPLFATRGPPGTHDTVLGCGVIDALRQGVGCRLPRFDKSRDDRRPESQWPEAPANCAVLILEGWCVGALPQSASDLQAPVNALEADEDPHGVWRAYVNDALAGPYRQLFEQIDYLVFLQAPGFDVVAGWRLQQEEQLRAESRGECQHLMDRGEIERFIQHYERLTLHVLQEMPHRADMVVKLDAERTALKTVIKADRDQTATRGGAHN